MSELVVGGRAPELALADDSGAVVRLSDLRGSPVVLFFYPEDDTPVCTQQACGYRDEWRAFSAAGAIVLGISPDDIDSHRRFRAKVALPFPLLSDPGNVVSKRYGAFGEKLMYGRRVLGTIRSSILIDAEGRIAAVHRNVRSAGNAKRMLADLAQITSAVPAGTRARPAGSGAGRRSSPARAPARSPAKRSRNARG